MSSFYGNAIPLGPNSVGTEELKDGAVNSNKLADGSVTKDKLEDIVKEVIEKMESFSITVSPVEKPTTLVIETEKREEG